MDVEQMGELEDFADRCLALAPVLRPHDEAAADSMEFTALRVRRTIDRLVLEGDRDG